MVDLCWISSSPGWIGASLFNWWFRPQLNAALGTIERSEDNGPNT